MPSEKRQRQREGREARREAARKAQQRAARRRQAMSVALLLIVIGTIGFLVSRGGDDEESAGTTTSTAAGDASTSTTEATATGSAECPPTDGTGDRRTNFDGAPKMCIDAERAYKAKVETNVGSFTIDLDARKAPQTVNNFVFLARYRYYENVPFHRVIPGFVVQGGDGQRGDGTGGPGYKFADELPAAGEYKIGSVAMANSGKDTNGSQFFVITGDQGVQLPPNYALFGTVSDGMDVVKRIEQDGSAEGTPKVKHGIVKVTIEET